MWSIRGFSLLTCMLLVASVPRSLGQITRPASLPPAPGVHISSYDAKTHKDSAYYTGLCRVVLKEFGLPTDSVPQVDLVFITEEMREELESCNYDRFGSSDWTGAFINPSLVFIIGESESDDTFMHEFMHLLQQKGRLFPTVPFSAVHPLIEMNEGLLMGSRSYLEFLKGGNK
jgi:hypothetical protein